MERQLSNWRVKLTTEHESENKPLSSVSPWFLLQIPAPSSSCPDLEIVRQNKSLPPWVASVRVFYHSNRKPRRTHVQWWWANVVMSWNLQSVSQTPLTGSPPCYTRMFLFLFCFQHPSSACSEVWVCSPANWDQYHIFCRTVANIWWENVPK